MRADGTVGAILKFSPPDGYSLASVRKDEQVRKYADRVCGIIENSQGDVERQLVTAMRETASRAAIAANTGSVLAQFDLGVDFNQHA